MFNVSEFDFLRLKGIKEKATYPVSGFYQNFRSLDGPFRDFMEGIGVGQDVVTINVPSSFGEYYSEKDFEKDSVLQHILPFNSHPNQSLGHRLAIDSFVDVDHGDDDEEEESDDHFYRYFVSNVMFRLQNHGMQPQFFCSPGCSGFVSCDFIVLLHKDKFQFVVFNQETDFFFLEVSGLNKDRERVFKKLTAYLDFGERVTVNYYYSSETICDKVYDNYEGKTISGFELNGVPDDLHLDFDQDPSYKEMMVFLSEDIHFEDHGGRNSTWKLEFVFDESDLQDVLTYDDESMDDLFHQYRHKYLRLHEGGSCGYCDKLIYPAVPIGLAELLESSKSHLEFNNNSCIVKPRAEIPITEFYFETTSSGSRKMKWKHSEKKRRRTK